MPIMRSPVPGPLLARATDGSPTAVAQLPLASSSTDTTPALGFAVLGLLLVASGAALGWWLFEEVDPIPFRPANDYSAFAALFIVAAAVERFLEPFTAYIRPDTAKAKQGLEAAVVTAASDPSQALEAANKQAELARARSERALVLWGAATLLATLVCAVLGVLLLRSVVAQPTKDPNQFVDLVVTGLVVGAGTKPLHDLISRIEKKKDKIADPPETST